MSKAKVSNPTVAEQAEKHPAAMGQDLLDKEDCSAFQGRLGFHGQSHAVLCKNHHEHWMLLGWTNSPDGGSWATCISVHPTWHDMKTISLEQSEEKLARELMALVGHKSFMLCHMKGDKG